jgi:hypothetical protein
VNEGPVPGLGDRLFTAWQMRRVPKTSNPEVTGFQWDMSSPPSFRNPTDIETKGLEFELTANLTSNWRVAVNAARSEAVNANVMGEAMDLYYAGMAAIAHDGYTPDDLRSTGSNWDNGSSYWDRTGFAHIDEWGAESSSGEDFTLNGDNHQMFGEKWVSTAGGGFGIEEAYLNAKAAEGRTLRELRKWRWNVVTNYDFKEGRLNGVGVGGAVRYQSASSLGFMPMWNNTAQLWVNDLSKPIEGPEEVNFDAWVSYRRRLSENVNMRVQLNARNLFSGKDLIPFSANPDGTSGQYRLAPTTNWELSTTFEF